MCTVRDRVMTTNMTVTSDVPQPLSPSSMCTADAMHEFKPAGNRHTAGHPTHMSHDAKHIVHVIAASGSFHPVLGWRSCSAGCEHVMRWPTDVPRPALLNNNHSSEVDSVGYGSLDDKCKLDAGVLGQTC